MLIAQNTSLFMNEFLEPAMAVIVSAIAAILIGGYAFMACKKHSEIELQTRNILLSLSIAAAGWLLTVCSFSRISENEIFLAGCLLASAGAAISFSDGLFRLILAPTVTCTLLFSIWLLISNMPQYNGVVINNLIVLAIFWLICSIFIKTAIADELLLAALGVALLTFDTNAMIAFFLVFIALVLFLHFIVLTQIPKDSKAQVAIVPPMFFAFGISTLFII